MAANLSDAVGEVTAKIVLLGETAVGKSSIATRFVREEFLANHESTIGAAFLSHTVQCPEGAVKFEIWDTAGQERYRSLAPMYYRGAVAAVIVYDVTSADSLKRSKSWLQELRRSNGGGKIIIALLGNKCDLDDLRMISVQEGQDLAEEEDCLFFETSAKTGINVEASFRAVAQEILRTGAAAPKPSANAPLGAREGRVPAPRKPGKKKCDC